MHNLDMIIDFQYGSTGKGLIAGWLAKRGDYDTAICAFATNAGHTYIDGNQHVMTQQLPTSIISPTVKYVLLGPGSAIHAETFLGEVRRYNHLIVGKQILIHPQAAVVEDYHADFEKLDGRTKMGSTAKGVGEAYIERIRRKGDANTAKKRWVDESPNHPMSAYVVSEEDYLEVLNASESAIVEGAQGFSLSLYHGQYPFTTSRDVTPWQIAADCGIPFKWATYVNVIGTLRTFPIRVSNRDGSSGPCYPDQREIQWSEIGLEPELTTVTKLPRRIFTFSHKQLNEAVWHCGGYWKTRIFLNFANYMSDFELRDLIKTIETPNATVLNHVDVEWIGFGPFDSDVMRRKEWDTRVLSGGMPDSEGGEL